MILNVKYCAKSAFGIYSISIQHGCLLFNGGLVMKRLALCLLMLCVTVPMNISCDDSSDKNDGPDYYLTYSVKNGSSEVAKGTLLAGLTDEYFEGLPGATLESYGATPDVLRCVASSETFTIDDIGLEAGIDYVYFEIPGTTAGTFISTNLMTYYYAIYLGGEVYTVTGDNFTITVDEEGASGVGSIKGEFSIEVENESSATLTLEAAFCLKRAVDEAINF
jgi:hypothetical protein